MEEQKAKLKIEESGAKETAKNIDSVSDSLDKLDKNQKKVEKNTKGKDLFKIGVLAAGVKQTAQKVIEFTKVSADYVETLNVLDVAFNNNTKSIREFTSAISETLNLDDATLIRAASRFKTLANSMSVANDVGEEFSKMLTQMTLDVSSLYNMDFAKTEQALQYAVMGRGTTLKQRTGVSVLETTVQTTLDTLGVDAYVEDMNDTEKALARVIAMSYQLRTSQGDLARTIEAPANQFRVLGEQVALAARNIGNIFLPAVASILPYINAVLIVINKLLSALATLFGFSESAWDFFGESDELIDTFDDIGASIGGVGDKAAGAAKKLQGLRAFDKLNNLTTPTSSSGGGGGAGGGGAGGINPNLLKAFKDLFGNYNTHLDGIKTKASQIAEEILKWLGFSYELDPITGELNLKYKGLKTTLNNMWKSFQKLSATGKFLVSLGLGLAATKLFNTIKKLAITLGATGLGKALKNLLSPTKFLVQYAAYGITNSTKLGNVISKLSVFMGKLKASLVGIISVAGGVAVLYDSFKKATEEGWNLSNTLGSLGGTLAIFVGAIKIGWEFGGAYGAAIAAAAAAVVTLTTAIIAANNALTPQEKELLEVKNALKEYSDAMNETTIAAEKELTSGLLQTTYHQNLLNELDQLVDANGNVKAGQEERVNFILTKLSEAYGVETQLINGQIQDYENLKNQIASVIKQKEAEYYVTMLQNVADKARSEQPKLLDTLNRATKNLTQAEYDEAESLIKLNEATKNYKNAKQQAGESDADFMKRQTELLTAMASARVEHDKATESVKKWQTQKDEATKAMESNNKKIQDYETAYGKFLSGQYDAYADIIKEYKNVYITEEGEIVKVSEDSAEKRIQDQKKILGEQKKSNFELYQDTVDTLANQTKAVEKLTPEQAAKWAALAIVDRERFMTEFRALPKDIQEQIVDKMGKKGEDINKELQKGLNKNKPSAEVKFNANTTNLTTGVQSWFNRNSSSLSKANVGFQLPKLTYAQGGLPPVGQMFIANERGPELVGQIGGQTFVANQNQMMDIIDKKLHNAGGLQNATFVIQVGNEEVARTVIKDLNSMAKSNGKPITITG